MPRRATARPFGSGPQLGYAAIPQAEVCKVLNEQALLMSIIETPGAVENTDAIAAVDGIDVLHIGASDLSTETGIPGQYTHERMRAAFETVAGAAKRHGKAMGSAACARISSSRAGCCG
jgi:2-keto-3-deoxy-L-rhamnonate aldolase RhmA